MTYATSGAARRQFSGAQTAPMRLAASISSVHSAPWRVRHATRSPRAMPSDNRPCAMRLAAALAYANVQRRVGVIQARPSGRSAACRRKTSLTTRSGGMILSAAIDGCMTRSVIVFRFIYWAREILAQTMYHASRRLVAFGCVTRAVNISASIRFDSALNLSTRYTVARF